MSAVGDRWLKFRIALSRWIYTPPAPRHHVPDSYVAVDIPWRDEENIRARLLLAHDAQLVVFSSSGEDRHLAAARAGFTIPPHKLRVTEFPNGAKMLDYSAHAPNDIDETWPPEGKDPLAGEADEVDPAFNRVLRSKRK